MHCHLRHGIGIVRRGDNEGKAVVQKMRVDLKLQLPHFCFVSKFLFFYRCLQQFMRAAHHMVKLTKYIGEFIFRHFVNLHGQISHFHLFQFFGQQIHLHQNIFYKQRNVNHSKNQNCPEHNA